MASGTPLSPFNRKYLGSKRLLRKWIADRIVEAAGVPETFLDGFCGTGAVSPRDAGPRRGTGHRRRQPALELRHPPRRVRRPRGSCRACPAFRAARDAERPRTAGRVHHRELRGHLLHARELPAHGRRAGGDRAAARRRHRQRGRARLAARLLPARRRPGGEHPRAVRRVPEAPRRRKHRRRPARARRQGDGLLRAEAPRRGAARRRGRGRRGGPRRGTGDPGRRRRLPGSSVQCPAVLRQLPRAGEPRPVDPARAPRQDPEVRPHGAAQPLLDPAGRGRRARRRARAAFRPAPVRVLQLGGHPVTGTRSPRCCRSGEP